MKVVVKHFAVNISTWSNQELAKYLVNLINPKSADQSVQVTKDIYDNLMTRFGSAPKLMTRINLKQLYQMYKSVKPTIADQSVLKSTIRKIEEKYDADIRADEYEVQMHTYHKAYGDGYKTYSWTKSDNYKTYEHQDKSGRVTRYKSDKSELDIWKDLASIAKLTGAQDLEWIEDYD